MEQIKGIISQVISNISSGKPEVRNKIQRLWQNIAEPKAIQHTAVVGLQKGELVIYVDSPAWLFQMNLKKRKLFERLKVEFPKLSNIRFKIGKIK